MLGGLLEDRGLSGADLARILGGSRNLGSMILRGERRLAANHIVAQKLLPSLMLELFQVARSKFIARNCRDGKDYCRVALKRNRGDIAF